MSVVCAGASPSTGDSNTAQLVLLARSIAASIDAAGAQAVHSCDTRPVITTVS